MDDILNAMAYRASVMWGIMISMLSFSLDGKGTKGQGSLKLLEEILRTAPALMKRTRQFSTGSNSFSSLGQRCV